MSEKIDKNQIGFDINDDNKRIKDENVYDIEETVIEDNKTNNENKVDYKKEIQNLTKKVNDLTSQFAEFYTVFEKCVLDKNEVIDVVKENKSVFDVETGKRIRYGEIDNIKPEQNLILPELKDDKIKSKITQNELPFFKNKNSWVGGSIGALLGGIPGAMIGASFGNSMINSKQRIGRTNRVVNIDNINGISKEYLLKNPVKNLEQMEQRLLEINPYAEDDKFFEAIKYESCNQDDSFFNDIVLSYFDYQLEEKRKKQELGLIDNIREFLINYPVKNFDEFVERIEAIDPHVNNDTLEMVKKHDDIDYYNKFLLEVYDNTKALERYRLAKTINENENYKYGIPYTKTDFSLYTLSNDLKNILKSRGMSLEKFSELIGVNKNTMTNIVNNKNTSSENMFKISTVLQLPIEEIFRYELKLDKYIREFLEAEIKESYNKKDQT